MNHLIHTESEQQDTVITFVLKSKQTKTDQRGLSRVSQPPAGTCFVKKSYAPLPECPIGIDNAKCGQSSKPTEILRPDHPLSTGQNPELLPLAYPFRTAFSMSANSSSVRNPKCDSLFRAERRPLFCRQSWIKRSMRRSGMSTIS